MKGKITIADQIDQLMKSEGISANRAAKQLGFKNGAPWYKKYGAKSREARPEKPAMVTLAVPETPEMVTVICCHVSRVGDVMRQVGALPHG